ncbi:leucine-rich repeat protein [Treponema phagedenis]|uniref:leucine-rich repeat protein n=1 Tax=Treponema phagedenis TaxID=162 RepID=UPI001655DE67|nr:leucine-rich repeat protein [Treponema phagedenis]
MKKTSIIFIMSINLLLFFACRQGVKTPDTVENSSQEVADLAVLLQKDEVVLSWSAFQNTHISSIEITVFPVSANRTAKTPAGIFMTTADKDSFLLKNLEKGKKYRFIVKTIDKNSNKSKGIEIEKFIPFDASDTTPAEEVSDLEITALNKAVFLAWKDPAEDDLHSIQISFVETAKARDELSAIVFTVEPKTEGFRISELEGNKEYTFNIQTIDKNGNKSNGITGKATPFDTREQLLKFSTVPAAEVYTKETVSISLELAAKPVKTLKWANKLHGITWLKNPKNGYCIEQRTPPYTFTVENSGAYSVFVEYEDETIDIQSINIMNIDTEPPYPASDFTVKYNFSKKELLLNNLQYIDDGCGVDKVIIKYDIEGKKQQNIELIQDSSLTSYTIKDVEPSAKVYSFSMKAVDKLGNESKFTPEQKITPTETATIVNVDIDRKKIDTYDSNRSVTVEITGTKLTMAEELKIDVEDIGIIDCAILNEHRARAKITNIPQVKKEYKITVLLRSSGSASLESQKETSFTVCDLAAVNEIKITHADGSKFSTDAYGAIELPKGTTGVMQILLIGSELDIKDTLSGVLFNNSYVNGTVNKNGTESLVEIPLPTAPGTYQIRPVLKRNTQDHYVFVAEATILRISGDAVYQGILLPGYKKAANESSGIIIKGENFDKIDTASLDISVSDGIIKNPKLIDSFTLTAEYLFPDTDMEGKDITVTIDGTKITEKVHSLQIDETGGVVGVFAIPEDGNLLIPNHVTAIKSGAFENQTTLKTIVLPESVSEIEERAFFGCTALQSIEIPEFLRNLGKDVFRGCTALTQIELPKNLVSIGDGAFYLCKSLKTITIPESITDIGNYVFTDSGVTDITIPERVTTIGVSAFYNCENLQRVKLPQNIASIGDNALYNCKSLTSLIFPATISNITIGENAFSGCEKLKIYVPSESIKEKMEKTGEGNQIIVYANSQDDFYFADKNKTELLYIDRQNQEEIFIPKNVCSIKSIAFSENKNLKKVIIPAGVTAIEKDTFKFCTSLETVKLPNTLVSIEQGSFYECAKLKNLVLPSGLKNIGKDAFFGCTALTLTLPLSITDIQYGAFGHNEMNWCKNLIIPSEPKNLLKQKAITNGYSPYRIK